MTASSKHSPAWLGGHRWISILPTNDFGDGPQIVMRREPRTGYSLYVGYQFQCADYDGLGSFEESYRWVAEFDFSSDGLAAARCIADLLAREFGLEVFDAMA